MLLRHFRNADAVSGSIAEYSHVSHARDDSNQSTVVLVRGISRISAVVYLMLNVHRLYF